MSDDKGKPVDEAGPSMPVEILGFDEVPEPVRSSMWFPKIGWLDNLQQYDLKESGLRKSSLQERSASTISSVR